MTIQEAGLSAIQQALKVARDAETAARVSAEVLDSRLAELREQAAAQSVETYMGGFGNALIFETTDLNTVPLLKFLLEDATGRNSDSAAQLRAVLQVRYDLLDDAEAAARLAASATPTAVPTVTPGPAATPDPKLHPHPNSHVRHPIADCDTHGHTISSRRGPSNLRMAHQRQRGFAARQPGAPRLRHRAVPCGP